MTQPTGKEVLLVEVYTNSQDKRLYLQIRNEKDEGIEIGPFGFGDNTQSMLYVRRIERHILVNWYSWWTILEVCDIMLFDRAVAKLTADCMLRTGVKPEHDRWMERHPLPAPTVVKIENDPPKIEISESFQSLMDSLIWPKKERE